MTNNYPIEIFEKPIRTIKIRGWGASKYSQLLAIHDVGLLAFDQGMCLAQVLRKNRRLLWELLGSDVENAATKNIPEAERTIATESSVGNWSSATVYISSRRRRMGISPDDPDSFERLKNEKINENELNALVYDAWGCGIAHAFATPAFVSSCFSPISLGQLNPDNQNWQGVVHSASERTVAYLSMALSQSRSRLNPKRVAELESLVAGDYLDAMLIGNDPI